MTIANTERFTKLDGLRGLLSIIVALNHSFLVVAIPSYANVWGENYFYFEGWQSKIQQLLMILGNGGVAVSMFFVLSGLVLGLSFAKFNPTLATYPIFILKRLVRLYPAYLFTILSISIFRWLGFDYRVFSPASTWYHWWMNFNLDFVEFLKNVFFIHINLGGVTWTLRVIIIMSFIFPWFFFASQKMNNFWNLVFTATLVYFSFTLLNIDGFRDLRYVYMFYLGLILPRYKVFFQKISPKLFSLILLILLPLMFIIRYQTDEYFGGVIESIISWFVVGSIVYLPNTKIFNFLENKLFVFLGHISYSLYLVHFSVLYALGRIMFQFLPWLDYSQYLLIHSILFVLSTTLAIPLSIFINKHIEKPPVDWVSNLLKSKTKV